MPDCEFDPTVQPADGFVWCAACAHWYPPTSVHAAILTTEGTTR